MRIKMRKQKREETVTLSQLIIFSCTVGFPKLFQFAILYTRTMRKKYGEFILLSPISVTSIQIMLSWLCKLLMVHWQH